ncbi:hypothetical protein P3X46_009649 [Hevea brasiliensis]|uniref:PGG domain-containing protein n=1 Tax=Hevea brasiliensis TaxID=3981 RepID=A0ABQ9MN04_HEVBR|nr:ankyrin repeat-containing protein BDA1-like [Hevea brasiliensis]KAJ9181526.1 hypothetical protein P3X46_009649 [Hevea brasiliensis]
MDSRLFDATLAGDEEALCYLLQGDPLILARISPSCAETPLHIACLLGYASFGREILRVHPPFVQQLNQDGYSPLHLASSNGHVEMVRMLLEFGHERLVVKELCMRTDQDGRTPLHCAVIRGRVDVMGELLAACPESASEVTVQKETILHLAVKNNMSEAFLFLLQGQHIKSLLNLADGEGNRVLHLAAVRKQIQNIRFLISYPRLDVNAVNSFGLTALDLLLIGPTNPNDLEIGEMIRSAGGVRSLNLFTSAAENQIQPITNNAASGPRNNDNMTVSSQETMDNENDDEHLKDMTNGLLMMASIVATVTFQIAVTPPGGFWQDSDSSSSSTTNSNTTAVGHIAGIAILYDRDRKNFDAFIGLNTQAFLASLSLIMALLCPTHARWKWATVRHVTEFLVFMIISLFVEAVTFTTKQSLYRSPLLLLSTLPWLFLIMFLVGMPFVISDSKRRDLQSEHV